MASPEDPFAVPVNSKKQKFVGVKDAKKNDKSSLVARCRAVVVANMERYPAEMFGMLGPDDWEEILRAKHQKTAPQRGSGGLDGTGRRTPAVSEKFLSDVEGQNVHLSESEVADQLVWKDLCEYQFSRAALHRPKGLVLPWPLLVKQMQEQAETLVKFKKMEDIAEDNEEMLEYSYEDEQSILQTTQTLKNSPMSLKLLKESGIGKVLKKLIKASKNRSPHESIFERIEMPEGGLLPGRASGKGKDIPVLKHLERQLQAWMDLAASIGVDMHGSSAKKGSGIDFLNDAADLRLAEECTNWRQLFSTLKSRADQRREKLGQKMRSNRKRENKVRPKIVKVSTMNSRRAAILNKTAASQATWERGGGGVKEYGGAKVLALRKEAHKQAMKQKGGLPKKSSGFGQAVAFATSTKLTPMQKAQQSKRKAKALVAMDGGKRMAVYENMKGCRVGGNKFNGSGMKKLADADAHARKKAKWNQVSKR